MTKKAEDFLLEIGTEELPPKVTHKLAEALAKNLSQLLINAGLDFSTTHHFSTPRRLAVRIDNLTTQQQDSLLEKKGPSKQAAFAENGEPTKALLGFLKSCHAMIDDLSEIETPKGTWLAFKHIQKGLPVSELLPNMVAEAIKKLPIPKMMRWSDHDFQFIRPVHWIVMLLGETVVPATLFDQESSSFTHGHRFLSPEMIQLKHPNEYEEKLMTQGHVMVKENDRKANIIKQVNNIAKELNASAIMDEALVAEVTNLVEWPTALLCTFDKALLNVPQEALISAMQGHQKCFPITNKSGKLLPYFVTVSNIQSAKPKKVIDGNEKVMEARLKDAAFFYENDQKTKLLEHIETLKRITYQKKLGSLFDKTERIRALAKWLAKKLNVDPKLTDRAALLCKTDLVTDMVGEFPELQGIMGSYYANLNGEPHEVAIAQKEAYMPTSAKSELPTSDIGTIVALADKCDTLASIFCIGLKPSGDKDPFALRRAALGILRILIEKQWPLSLNMLFLTAAKPLKALFDPNAITEEVVAYCIERLKNYYKDQGIGSDVFQAVKSISTDVIPVDFDKKIQAVNAFKALPQAANLAAANKRVQNILNKNDMGKPNANVTPKLLVEPEEKILAGVLTQKEHLLLPLAKKGDYRQILTQLADLQGPVDDFFDHVMVMSEDNQIKNNRLAILYKLRSLFLLVADISKLQM